MECPTCHKTFQFLHISGQCFGCAVPAAALQSQPVHRLRTNVSPTQVPMIIQTSRNTSVDPHRAITYVQCYCGAQRHAYDTASMRTHNTERAAIQQAINACPKCGAVK